MFKRLKKSVIDKNKLLLTNLSKKRVNKTPSKIIFPNKTNLTFANIIVNMNSTPSFRSVDSWNSSYFNTELYNNSFSNKSSKNSIMDISRNNSETKDDHSEILSIIINGILCLKSNDLLNYCIKLIEIITYIRDTKDKYNYIDINSEMNKDLLMIIYQIYFRIFPENSFIYLIIKNDLKNGMKIFKKIHSIYILYLLSGLSYIHDKLKSSNAQFFNFLKQFIKKEKCLDSKCPICINTEKIEKNNSFVQKTSVIKIMNRKFKKNSNINNRIKYCPKMKKNIISISNDNINHKKVINNKSIENNYYTSIINESSKGKNIFINKSKNDLYDIKKKIFSGRMINSDEKAKNKFFNHSSKKNKIHSSKITHIIQNQEKKDITINYSDKIDLKKYNTEKSENENKKPRRIEGKIIDEIKIKLNKNNINNNPLQNSKKKIKNLNKIIDFNENNNNNKIIDSNKSNKYQLTKAKKITINILGDSKTKKERKICINLEESEKIRNNNSMNNIEKNDINENKYSLDESSKIISENINSIEKEINEFKEHNLFIKQQLEKMFNKNK